MSLIFFVNCFVLLFMCNLIINLLGFLHCLKIFFVFYFSRNAHARTFLLEDKWRNESTLQGIRKSTFVSALCASFHFHLYQINLVPDQCCVWIKSQVKFTRENIKSFVSFKSYGKKLFTFLIVYMIKIKLDYLYNLTSVEMCKYAILGKNNN